jgi:hypothetical protein
MLKRYSIKKSLSAILTEFWKTAGMAQLTYSELVKISQIYKIPVEQVKVLAIKLGYYE